MPEPERLERDALGPVPVPAGAYYGAQTERARQNFPISGEVLPDGMIRAIALVKIASTRALARCGALEPRLAEAIERAAHEVRAGRFDAHFVVDAYQAGAGTSFHMNANEVIANRANELLGGQLGSYRPIHPNDHVNLGQSTNDVFPTAMRLAALLALPGLDAALGGVETRLAQKAREFERVIKAGRTHLQDAVPITLGQEFGAYARAITLCRERLLASATELHALGLGGSAAGTGLNTPEGYRERAVEELRTLTGLRLSASPNLFEAMQSLAPFGELSAALRRLALELVRISNDLRLLASGPRTGLAEIRLPAIQPGSSMMPGKVNPSVLEMLTMLCFQVIGHDTAIALAQQAGQLELNVMMPLVARNLLIGMSWLERALGVLDARCLSGLEANEAACREWAWRSQGLATALNPVIGYQQAAELAKEAAATGRNLPDLVRDRGMMSEAEARRFFSPERLTGINRPELEFLSAEPPRPETDQWPP